MLLRNRVERHEMHRHFAADAAPWDPALDESSEESRSMQMSLSRHSAANFSSHRVPEQAAVVSSDAGLVPLSTGQSMGKFCDPISMELPTQTYRSEIQIELSDSRTAKEEARADSHVAPATRVSEVWRQISIAAPVAFYDLQGSNHNPRAQSTRYPLSLHPPHENSTFVENTMDLIGGACATGVIIPETTTGEAMRGPSTIFERTSFLPLPAFSLQPTSYAPTARHQRRECSGVVTMGVSSSSSSQFIPFRATDVVGDSDVPCQGNMGTNRIDFSSGISSQPLGYAERGAGAAVYSQCPMPRGVPCYQEPLLMPSAPVAQNSFTAAASQASGYGVRAEPACSYIHQPVPLSFYYLVLGRNLCCPRSSHFNMLRRIHSTMVIIRIRFRKFRLPFRI